MTRRMTQSTTPSYTVESLATFRQQVEESHHDLMTMLTHQMATVLNPLIESNNQYFDTINKQMNKMVEALHLDDVEDPIIQQLANQPLILPHLFDEP